MKKILFALVAIFMGISSISAQSKYHLGEIAVSTDSPTTFDLVVGDINYFQITAPASGMLEFNVGYSSAIFYLTDSEWSEDNKTTLSRETTSNGVVVKCDVVEGQTYYFSTSPILDPVTVIASYSTGETSISLSSNYQNGDMFNMTGSNLELTFDHIVTVDKALVLYGDGKQEEIPADYINTIYVNDYYYTILLRDLVEHLMDGGKLAVGDQFTIRLEGIRDAENPDKIYGEDGTYEVTLVLAEMPASLVSIDPADGSNLDCYYPEDSEDGFIVFTFSEPLNEDKTNVRVSMSWGDMEVGSYQQHFPDFTISGNTVTVDIRGIIIPENVESGRGMSTSTTVTVSIDGLTTAKGGSVETNYPGTGTSSIIAVYGVNEQESLIYDFIPQNGCASLEGYDEIIVWTNIPILYDGITLGWVDARGNNRSRTLSPDEAPFKWDDYEEGYLAHVPINTISWQNGVVTVNVDNARLMNGDSVTIYGEFNTVPTGIDNVTAGNADADVKVYTVDGRLVKTCKAANATEGLEKGVYIVGGKKLVVK